MVVILVVVVEVTHTTNSNRLLVTDYNHCHYQLS